MPDFLTPLDLQFIDGKLWSILTPLEFRLGAPDGPETVIIAEGFKTDFASIPRGLWNVLPPIGLYGKAAVVHDWLYQRRLVRLRANPTKFRYCDRAEADLTLLEGMQVLKVPAWQRWLIYSGVRVGGWITWNRYRRQEEQLRQTIERLGANLSNLKGT